MTLKSYFQEPTVAEIRNLPFLMGVSDNLVDDILSLSHNESLIIETDLIPERDENARKFMRHGTEVKLPRYRSLEDALRHGKTPVQLREVAFNKISSDKAYCAYSFKPFSGTDKRTRRVPLGECLEGTRIYCYANQESAISSRIEVRPYDDAKRVEKDGAEIVVRVPSRTEKKPKYEFKFSSVPVVDSIEKWALANNLVTDHSCKSKRFNIRYKYTEDKETSKIFNFCAHEVAGYLSIIDYYWTDEKNMIPLQMSQFAIPTQETVDFYKKLDNNCIIQTPDDKKPRKLNMAEKEILLWNLVHKLGHDKTFFARKSLKAIRDYDWT